MLAKGAAGIAFFVPAVIGTILAPTNYSIVTIPLLAIAGINLLRLGYCCETIS